MDSKTREELTENVIDCIHSLDHSLQQCKGGDMESTETLKSMTMFNFICHVAAPNGIRFHYESRSYEEQTKEKYSTAGGKMIQVKSKEDLNDIEVHTQPD